MLRKAGNLILVFIFIVGAIAVYRFVRNLEERAETVISPVERMVQGLFVEVTPVILPSSTTIVRELNAITVLETAEIELEKIITAETNQDLLWGAFGESLIFVGYGKVYAGVDMSQMQPEDIQVVDPNTVMIHLPPVEILADRPILDNEQSQVLDRDEGIFADADPQLETQVRQAAEEAILEEAMASGLLELGQTNAETFMRSFLNGLGFENVIFTEDTPPVAEPYEQETGKGEILPTATPQS